MELIWFEKKFPSCFLLIAGVWKSLYDSTWNMTLIRWWSSYAYLYWRRLTLHFTPIPMPISLTMYISQTDCGPMNITSFLFRWSPRWISCSLLKVVFTTYLLMFHHVQFAFFTFSSAPSNDFIFLVGIFMKIFFWRLRSLLGILFLGGDVCQQITQIWASLPCKQNLWLSKCSLPQLLSHKLIWSSRYIPFSDTLQVSYRGSRWKAWFLCSSIVRRMLFS